jgi:hypothetical protein
MNKKLILVVALSLAIIGGSVSTASAQCCCFNPFAWFSCCGCGSAAIASPPPQYVPQQYIPPADRDVGPPRQDLN